MLLAEKSGNSSTPHSPAPIASPGISHAGKIRKTTREREGGRERGRERERKRESQ